MRWSQCGGKARGVAFLKEVKQQRCGKVDGVIELFSVVWCVGKDIPQEDVDLRAGFVFKLAHL